MNMRKNSRLNAVKPFVDGAIDIRRWQARRKMKRRFAWLSAHGINRTVVVVAGLLLALAVAALLIGMN